MDVQLSVVIATLDRAHLLAGALDALSLQQVPPGLDWEILVVDNGSTDGTPDVVAAAATRAGAAGPGRSIRYVHEAAQGLSHARNRGVREARGAIIAFTDDDVLPAPDWVASIVAAMDRWQADGVGGRILPRWEAEPPSWLVTDRRLLDRLAIMDADVATLLALPIDHPPKVWGANMAFRRHAFETTGSFDPRLGVAGRRLYRGEETDFVERALERGLRIAYDASLVVHHRIGPDRMRPAYFRRLFFDAGQSEARVADVTGRRTLLGAPLHLYRVPVHVVRWLLRAALRRPNAFRTELRWRHELGQLTGHWRSRAAGRDQAATAAAMGDGVADG